VNTTLEKENKPLKKKHRKQKFTEKWLSQPEFSAWLSHDKNDKYKAKCMYCCYSMNADLIVIKRHGQSARHIQKMQAATMKQRSISWFTDKKQCVDKTLMSTLKKKFRQKYGTIPPKRRK